MSSFAQDDASFVEEAATWADKLVRAESSGPGDFENARRRVARQIGVPFSLLWNLKYRTPKEISPAKYIRIGGAFGELSNGPGGKRQEAKTWLGQVILRAADALESRASEMDREAEALDREAQTIDGKVPQIDGALDG